MSTPDASPEAHGHRPPTTAIILCGGHASRLGGVDKPLLDLAGKCLLGRVIAGLSPQVDAIVISAGQAAARYEPFGLPVVKDREPDQGPLSGIVSALAAVETPWILTTQGDTPFLPGNLVEALAAPCRRRGAAVVTAGGHRQNLTMLLDRRRADSLAAFYQSGGRAVHRWLTAHEIEEVALPEAGFFNINTPEDLARARELVETPPA